jgi:hypothetical protein
MKTIANRMTKPTPGFFKKIRNVGLTIAGLGATVLASPVALPAIIIKIAGYFVVAGGVMGTVSQAAVKNEKK